MMAPLLALVSRLLNTCLNLTSRCLLTYFAITSASAINLQPEVEQH
jgi:hypothetical protein